jgi:hypothetical protein
VLGEATGWSCRAGLPDRAAGRVCRGGAAGRSCRRSGAPALSEAAGGAKRNAAIGLRVFRGMRVVIDYKLSVTSVSACASPNLRSRNAGRDENTHSSN